MKQSMDREALRTTGQEAGETAKEAFAKLGKLAWLGLKEDKLMFSLVGLHVRRLDVKILKQIDKLKLVSAWIACSSVFVSTRREWSVSLDRKLCNSGFFLERRIRQPKMNTKMFSPSDTNHSRNLLPAGMSPK